MDRLEAIDKLKELQEIEERDSTISHSNADNILCKLLCNLGFKDVVNEYAKIESKRYLRMIKERGA